MGLGIGAVQNILELNNLGYFKNSNSTIEIGSQELHVNFVDLKKLFETAGLKDDLESTFPNVKNWPFGPRCPSKYFYKELGIKNYECIDINGLHESIAHDLNNSCKYKSNIFKIYFIFIL